MKKILLYVKIFFIFILCYFLQSNLFTWFNIAGIQPNLFIILILIIGLFTGKMSGLVCGVICGIFIDLLVQINVIIEPILLGLTGYSTGLLRKNFSTDSRMNIMVMVIATTFFYELLAFVLKILIYSTDVEIGPFLKIILLEMLYNAIIVIIIYPIVRRINRKTEEKLFENRVLRYY